MECAVNISLIQANAYYPRKRAWNEMRVLLREGVTDWPTLTRNFLCSAPRKDGKIVASKDFTDALADFAKAALSAATPVLLPVVKDIVELFIEAFQCSCESKWGEDELRSLLLVAGQMCDHAVYVSAMDADLYKGFCAALCECVVSSKVSCADVLLEVLGKCVENNECLVDAVFPDVHKCCKHICDSDCTWKIAVLFRCMAGVVRKVDLLWVEGGCAFVEILLEMALALWKRIGAKDWILTIILEIDRVMPDNFEAPWVVSMWEHAYKEFCWMVRRKEAFVSTSDSSSDDQNGVRDSFPNVFKLVIRMCKRMITTRPDRNARAECPEAKRVCIVTKQDMLDDIRAAFQNVKKRGVAPEQSCWIYFMYEIGFDSKEMYEHAKSLLHVSSNHLPSNGGICYVYRVVSATVDTEHALELFRILLPHISLVSALDSTHIWGFFNACIACMEKFSKRDFLDKSVEMFFIGLVNSPYANVSQSVFKIDKNFLKLLRMLLQSTEHRHGALRVLLNLFSQASAATVLGVSPLDSFDDVQEKVVLVHDCIRIILSDNHDDSILPFNQHVETLFAEEIHSTSVGYSAHLWLAVVIALINKDFGKDTHLLPHVVLNAYTCVEEFELIPQVAALACVTWDNELYNLIAEVLNAGVSIVDKVGLYSWCKATELILTVLRRDLWFDKNKIIIPIITAIKELFPRHGLPDITKLLQYLVDFCGKEPTLIEMFDTLIFEDISILSEQHRYSLLTAIMYAMERYPGIYKTTFDKLPSRASEMLPRAGSRTVGLCLKIKLADGCENAVEILKDQNPLFADKVVSVVAEVFQLNLSCVDDVVSWWKGDKSAAVTKMVLSFLCVLLGNHPEVPVLVRHISTILVRGRRVVPKSALDIFVADIEEKHGCKPGAFMRECMPLNTKNKADGQHVAVSLLKGENPAVVDKNVAFDTACFLVKFSAIYDTSIDENSFEHMLDFLKPSQQMICDIVLACWEYLDTISSPVAQIAVLDGLEKLFVFWCRTDLPEQVVRCFAGVVLGVVDKSVNVHVVERAKELFDCIKANREEVALQFLDSVMLRIDESELVKPDVDAILDKYCQDRVMCVIDEKMLTWEMNAICDSLPSVCGKKQEMVRNVITRANVVCRSTEFAQAMSRCLGNIRLQEDVLRGEGGMFCSSYTTGSANELLSYILSCQFTPEVRKARAVHQTLDMCASKPEFEFLMSGDDFAFNRERVVLADRATSKRAKTAVKNVNTWIPSSYPSDEAWICGLAANVARCFVDGIFSVCDCLCEVDIQFALCLLPHMLNVPSGGVIHAKDLARCFNSALEDAGASTFALGVLVDIALFLLDKQLESMGTTSQNVAHLRPWTVSELWQDFDFLLATKKCLVCKRIGAAQRFVEMHIERSNSRGKLCSFEYNSEDSECLPVLASVYAAQGDSASYKAVSDRSSSSVHSEISCYVKTDTVQRKNLSAFMPKSFIESDNYQLFASGKNDTTDALLTVFDFGAIHHGVLMAKELPDMTSRSVFYESLVRLESWDEHPIFDGDIIDEADIPFSTSLFFIVTNPEDSDAVCVARKNLANVQRDTRNTSMVQKASMILNAVDRLSAQHTMWEDEFNDICDDLCLQYDKNIALCRSDITHYDEMMLNVLKKFSSCAEGTSEKVVELLLRASKRESRAKNWTESERFLMKAGEISEDQDAFELMRAKATWKMGQRETALVNLDRLRREKPDSSVKHEYTMYAAQWYFDLRVEPMVKCYELFEQSVSAFKDNPEKHSKACFKFAWVCDRFWQSLTSGDAEKEASDLRQVQEEKCAKLKDMGSDDSSDNFRRRVIEKEELNVMAVEQDLRAIEEKKKKALLWALKLYGEVLRHTDPKHEMKAVFRFCALWFSEWSNDSVGLEVRDIMRKVPPSKFHPLLYQLSGRLGCQTTGSPPEKSAAVLYELVERVANVSVQDTLLLMIALTSQMKAQKEVSDAVDYCDTFIDGKVENAVKIITSLREHDALMVDQTMMLAHELVHLAGIKSKRQASKGKLSSALLKTPFDAVDFACFFSGAREPLQLVRLKEEFTLVGGIHRPKKITCVFDNGREASLLVKGSDDLRQDAVMQQIFGAVNALLGNINIPVMHFDEPLEMRGYRVVALSPRAGVLEWVENVIGIGDFLQGAHVRYNPRDVQPDTIRDKMFEELHSIREGKDDMRHERFCELTEGFTPAFHHFFDERFNGSPQTWIAARTRYACSCATGSMVGYVIGLGDRHAHNVLIDTHNGELVHIDLGIAFDNGTALTIPERVPFRLTRDMVDGLGVLGTNGLYREVCLMVMKALREKPDVLLMILDVLRYDPLYAWCLKPATRERVQSEDLSLLTTPKAEFLPEPRKQNDEAARVIQKVRRKLSGTEFAEILSVEGQVNQLINMARDTENLARMFPGWQPWL